jgi:non-ribosomal peptide synthase protein (TIGR01720 family)
MQMNSLHKRVQVLTPAQRAELARRLSLNGGGLDSNLPAATGKRLVAYVAHSSDIAPDAGELRRHLQGKLPDYMIPAEFVLLADLPRTANGKIDRRALQQMEISRKPAEAADDLVAPRTAVESQLLTIWVDVLGSDLISIHDNFFEIGGDSILSIQIAARANQAGLKLTPQQLFQNPTIAQLAAVARIEPESDDRVSTQAEVTGPVVLTPIQRWFFEQPLDRPEQWNQAMLLQTPASLNPAALAAAIQQIWQHHDGLRLQFRRTPAGWQQTNEGVETAVSRQQFDLTTLTPSQRTGAVTRQATNLHRSLRLDEPLIRFAYFNCGSDPGRLLIITHHLVVDGVSWRILLEDLATAYRQAASGEPITLPAKTTAYRGWAQRLADYAQTTKLRDELAYWQRPIPPDAAAIPLDFADGDGAVGATRQTTRTLSAEETKALLTQVPQTYHTEINDVLLTALLQTINGWTGRSSLLFGLEGHGREPLFADVDLSRTVGWFTTFYPVLLQLETADLGRALKSIKEQLRAIPNRGIGYGLLRYLCPDEQMARTLSTLPQPQVTFNYLGRFDGDAGENKSFGLIDEPTGAARYEQDGRLFLLEIDALVQHGRFQINWRYSTNQFRPDTIERLADRFMETLRLLVDHCLAPHTGGHTPSDFALAGLDQEEMDLLSGLLEELDD